MENPAIRITRQSKDASKDKPEENTTNPKPTQMATRQKQNSLLSYFSKKKDITEHCSTPKKKQKISSSSKCSRETTPKKTAIPVQPIEEEAEHQEKLPKNQKHLEKLLNKVKQKINLYKSVFFQEEREIQEKKSKISDDAIPICSDIRTFDYDKLAKEQIKNGGRLFDVIMMDPPWQLSSSQPSRGVAIAYDSLSDENIMKMPIDKLQTDGFIFIWAINAKYRFSCKLIEHWGYKLVDEITWVKKTVNGKIAKGHGFYLQHAKESCLIGVKGNIDEKIVRNVASDVIFSERRGQSQKPEEIYQYIEQLVPNGFYMEIFGRRNNLRKNWVTIGNEL